MRLSQLHSKSVGVVFAEAEQPVPVSIGIASYEQDDELGQILKIVFKEEGLPKVLIQESEWRGEIILGGEWNCDFCVGGSPLTPRSCMPKRSRATTA